MKVISTKIVNGKKMFLIEEPTKLFAQNGFSSNPYYVPIQGSASSENTRTKLTPKTKLTPQELDKIKNSQTSAKAIALKEAADKATRLAKSNVAYKKRIDTGIQSSQDMADETGAIGDKISLQNLPYVGKYIPDFLDATGMIGNMASGLGRIPLNLEKGNYGQAALDVAIPLGVGTLAGVSANTTGEFINNIVNPLAGTGQIIDNIGNKYLPNAYKLNPYAFKPNPEAYYHRSPNIENIINKESGNLQGFGQSDAGKLFNETAGPGRNPNGGINLKKAANNDVFYSKGVPLDYGRYNSISKGMSGQGYPGPFLVESKGVPMVSSSQGKRKLVAPSNLEGYATSTRPINSNEVNFYKEDWLKGYKQIETPKTTQNFKSEINWGQWNKEIPENPQLMKEYNAIEQTSKANGTWMKNPDGSVFQGTPEQFVQQNSENFKKAFGNSKLVNPDGSPTIQYHGSAKKFDTFDESKFQLGDSGYSGVGIYTTPSKSTAQSYAMSSSKFHSGKIEPTVYELYGQANNPISSSLLIKENKGRDLFNFHRKNNWKGELTPEESLMEFDAAIADQLPNVERIRPWNDAREIVFPSNKQLKSAIGNNGMFDMTNPNIYKSIVGALATGTLGKKAMRKKEFGGKIKILKTKISNGKTLHLIED